ncbi:2-iminobutanoate/2-iminopropanoate deaminase [Pedobacter sp. UYP30]|uniref:RidA family protein n=1 Tax=Pedobacter sp. UYP30 TaxID=1756400 RepID=UPI0033978011
MKTKMRLTTLKLLFLAALFVASTSCNQKADSVVETKDQAESGILPSEKPDYFLLHPKLEKMYGFSQAVRIGNTVKISGTVSIDEDGKTLGKGNLLQQMKNIYVDLGTILNHYHCTFDDVMVENLFTTNMKELQKNAAFRHEIYKNHFPTGSWIGVKELGLPEMMIEIEIEALIPEKG